MSGASAIAPRRFMFNGVPEAVGIKQISRYLHPKHVLINGAAQTVIPALADQSNLPVLQTMNAAELTALQANLSICLADPGLSAAVHRNSNRILQEALTNVEAVTRQQRTLRLIRDIYSQLHISDGTLSDKADLRNLLLVRVTGLNPQNGAKFNTVNPATMSGEEIIVSAAKGAIGSAFMNLGKTILPLLLVQISDALRTKGKDLLLGVLKALKDIGSNIAELGLYTIRASIAPADLPDRIALLSALKTTEEAKPDGPLKDASVIAQLGDLIATLEAPYIVSGGEGQIIVSPNLAGRTVNGGRSKNQDSLLLKDGLAVLCDGMGGMGGPDGGKIASTTGILSAERASRDADFTLEKGFTTARADLLQARQTSGSTMNTTFEGFQVNGDKAIIAHAGDSRTYLIRGGILILGIDHTFRYSGIGMDETEKTTLLASFDKDLRENVSIGRRYYEKFLNINGNNNNSVIRNLADGEVDTFEVLLQPGDILITASDGLNALPYEKLAEIINANRTKSADVLVDALIQGAIDAGTRDNVTVMAYKHPGAVPQPVVVPTLTPEQQQVTAYALPATVYDPATIPTVELFKQADKFLLDLAYGPNADYQGLGRKDYGRLQSRMTAFWVDVDAPTTQQTDDYQYLIDMFTGLTT